MTQNPIDLSLVIPCYNDGALLMDSLAEIHRVMDQTQYTYELIVIDDCSPDGSAATVRALAKQDNTIRCVCHETNVGRGGTVAEGFRAARGIFVGYLDIDLEVHCRYIPSMLAALEQGADGATAFRIYKFHYSPSIMYRGCLSIFYRKMVRFLLHLPFEDTETGFKFFKREKIIPLLDRCQSQGWFWDTEIMAWMHYSGFRVKEIPALFLRRWDKPSTVKPLQDSIQYLRELLRFRRRLNQAGKR
ncbi:MAG: glycosyltransferase family 2 protein [bacterium]|jgi:glycosyltransferase involved in cell wall biosynthesis|nr:glycosyltransferase family 2 protein [bacterium]